GARAPRDLHVFPDIPIDFEPLRGADADGDISIRELVLDGGRRLEDVRVQFTLRDGKLGAPVLQASVFGGSVQGRLDADVSRGHAPSMTLRLEAKGLDAAALLAAAGAKRDIHGGKTDLRLDLALHGASPREWASSASGSAVAFVGPATLSNTRIELDSPLMRLAEAINPFIKVDPSTELHCAVARLPLKNGV